MAALSLSGCCSSFPHWRKGPSDKSLPCPPRLLPRGEPGLNRAVAFLIASADLGERERRLQWVQLGYSSTPHWGPPRCFLQAVGVVAEPQVLKGTRFSSGSAQGRRLAHTWCRCIGPDAISSGAPQHLCLKTERWRRLQDTAQPTDGHHEGTNGPMYSPLAGGGRHSRAFKRWETR